jgi:hypothetical protein
MTQHILDPLSTVTSHVPGRRPAREHGAAVGALQPAAGIPIEVGGMAIYLAQQREALGLVCC